MLFNFENEDNLRDLQEETLFFESEDELFAAFDEEYEIEDFDEDVYEMVFGEDANFEDEYEVYDESFEALNEMFESIVEANEEMLNEASIVKFDIKTIRKRLMRRAQLICAKEANDPLYHKYVALSKKRKEIRNQIANKYEAKAKAKLKHFLALKKNKNANK